MWGKVSARGRNSSFTSRPSGEGWAASLAALQERVSGNGDKADCNVGSVQDIKI